MSFIVSAIAVAFSVTAFFGAGIYGGDDFFGAISYPTSLDSFTDPTATSKTNSPSHATLHTDTHSAIEALEAKVGVDSSAVTTSHDYKLSGVTGSDVACSLTGTETLTNKTLNSATIATTTAWNTTFNGTTTVSSSGYPLSIDLGSDATGDIYYRDSNGDFQRLAVGTSGQFLQASTTGLPDWVTSDASAPTAEKTPNANASITLDGSTYARISFIGRTNNGCLYTSPCTVSMLMDAEVLASTTVGVGVSADGSGDTIYLLWTGTHAATTSATLSTSGATLVDYYWIVEKY